MLCIQPEDLQTAVSRQSTAQSTSTVGNDSLTEAGPTSSGYNLSQLKISGDSEGSVCPCSLSEAANNFPTVSGNLSLSDHLTHSDYLVSGLHDRQLKW